MSRFRRFESHLTATLSLVLSLSTIALIIIMADRGFDFTDEGFYLNWISKPFLYEGSLTQFGFIYHPIFEYFNGNIAAFRRFNVIAIGTIAFAFANMLVLRWCPSLSKRPFLKFAVCFGVAVSAFVQIQWLLLTPSYNWLNLAGVLCFLIGAFGITAGGSRRNTFFWASLIGLAIWLSAMAKPPTGVALSVVLLPFAFMVSGRPLVVIATAGGVSSGLMLVSALAIDGSLPAFIRRILLSQELAAALWTGYSSSGIWTRIDPLVMSAFEQKVFWITFGLSGVAAWLTLRECAWTVCGRLAFSVIATIATLLVILGFSPFQIEQSLMQGVWLAAVPTGVITVVIASRWRRIASLPSIKFVASVFLLMFVPLAYAVGTGNNYWFQSAHLLLVWIGAVAVIIYRAFPAEQGERLLGTLSLGSVVMTRILISIGIDYPYRSSVSLRHQTKAVEIGERASILKLTPESSDYIQKLREAAFRNGFLPGTPVLDLTGRHPASVFALGGTAPGLAWILSGFPGSVQMAQSALGRVSCAELAKAWLIVAEYAGYPQMSMTPLMSLRMGSSTPLPTNALKPLGIDRERGYHDVITIASPVGYGIQTLLAPTAQDETKVRCESARSTTLGATRARRVE